MTAVPLNAQPTFEETYPKAPFADLIRLTLALADILVKLRARTADPAQAGSGRGQYA